MGNVEKLDDQVWRIRLKQPVPVDVFSYLITSSKITLIDCGHKSPISQQDLLAAFEEIGIVPSDVDQIILTHCHVDHIGALVSGGPLFKNTPVIACHGAAESVVGFDHFNSIRHNVPDDKIFKRVIDDTLISASADYYKLENPLVIHHEVRSGDLIDIGGDTLQVIETPGHSESHISLLRDRSASLFAGDIVSSTGPPGLIVDLEQYIGTLNRLRSMTLSRIYPGHGPIINQPQEAIDLALNRIHQTDELIIDYIRMNARTPFEIALQFTRGEVNPRTRFFINITLIHLERLSKKNMINLEYQNGIIKNITLA